jgi:hypothetical protein
MYTKLEIITIFFNCKNMDEIVKSSIILKEVNLLDVVFVQSMALKKIRDGI